MGPRLGVAVADAEAGQVHHPDLTPGHRLIGRQSASGKAVVFWQRVFSFLVSRETRRAYGQAGPPSGYESYETDKTHKINK